MYNFLKATIYLLIMLTWSTDEVLNSTVYCAFQPTYSLEQSDLTGDGVPDLTIIQCHWVTNNDLVYIFDGDSDMKVSNDWKQSTDFVNDIWIFDVNGDGNAQLIIRFVEENGFLSALLYDDQTGDGEVSYEVDGKSVLITESDSWTLKITVEDDWFLANGSLNQNLRFYYADKDEVVSGVVDRDRNGIADYEFWNVFMEQSSSESNRQQPGLWVNKGMTESAIPDQSLFWPLLIANNWPSVQNKFDLTPFIVVDWEKAVIEDISVGKDRSGYPIETGFFIFPTSSLILDHTNYINFENPMAYYDLANDQDGWPELHIRLTYYGPDDVQFDFGRVPIPFNEVRYSWNQGNTPGLTWDYKIGLAGTNLITSTIQFDEFGIQTVPYESLPDWVISSNWGWGTFVAQEGNARSPSSEGIYEWPAGDKLIVDASLPGDDPLRYTASQQMLRGYVTGLSTEPPDDSYDRIRMGMRGEFAYLTGRPLTLYFSPVDTRLHLSWAEHGVWNIDGDKEIRYINHNADIYFDEWRYLENGLLKNQLNVSSNHLVLANPEEGFVTIKQVSIQPQLFQVPPPRNHTEWLVLGQNLERHQRDFAPEDLMGMFAQFEGSATEIAGATMRDYRLTGGGFRFVLDLQSDFQLLADPLQLQSALTGSGTYVVEYDGRQFIVQPWSPASLYFSPPQLSATGEAASAFTWHTIESGLANEGLEDVYDLIACLNLTKPDGAQAVLTTTVPLLPGAGQTQLAWRWSPDTVGVWMAQADVNCEADNNADWPAQPSEMTTIEIISPPSSGWPESASSGFSSSVNAFMVLIGAILLAGLLAAIWYRSV